MGFVRSLNTPPLRLRFRPKIRLGIVEVASLIPTIWWAGLATATSHNSFMGSKTGEWRLLLSVLTEREVGWFCVLLVVSKVAGMAHLLPRRFARLPMGVAGAWWAFCLTCLILARWESTTAGFVFSAVILNTWGYLRADQ